MGKIVKIYKVAGHKDTKAFYKTSSLKKALAKAKKHNMSQVGKQTDNWNWPMHVSVYGYHPVYGWGYFGDGDKD